MFDRYIIDTGSLIQHPQILSRSINHKIIIPKAVLKELSQRGKGHALSDIYALVNSSISAGVKIADTPENIKVNLDFLDKDAEQLSGADFDIVRIAIGLSEKYPSFSTCVVTTDKALARFLQKIGIKSLTASEFLSGSSREPINRDIATKAKQASKNQRRYLIRNFLLGIFTGSFSAFVYDHIDSIISTITIWGTLLGLPLVGIALFWFREKYRLSYGLLEFIAGVVMAYKVFIPSFSYTALGATEGIQILGGLYAMVRGLDNIGKGVAGTRLEGIWQRLF